MTENSANEVNESKTSRLIILFISIGLATLLFILWLVDFSQFNISEFIPGTETRVYGVLIFISFIIIFIFLQKNLLKVRKQTSVLNLTIASTVVAFVSLFLYQLIRQLIILRGQYSYDLLTVLISSAFPLIPFLLLAASISLEVKKVKGIWIHVPTLLLVILYLLAKPYLHLLEW